MNKKSAILWLAVRLYVGWAWIEAGWGKLHNPAWVGGDAGAALTGFVRGAIAKTAGEHPAVQSWYASFLENVVLPHATLWSYMVATGEFLIGVGLIFGVIVGVTAFFGAFMNWNFLMAGTVSVNPILIVLSFALMLSWRVAGYLGIDYYVLPFLRKLTRRK